MVQRVSTVAFEGIEARAVDVQAQGAPGPPPRAGLAGGGGCAALPQDAIAGFTVLGELGLDGSIAPVAGVLPAAIGANARGQGLICPAACGPEGAWARPEIEIVAGR